MNTSLQHLRVLVAPLDWGLGHATRCIPIINSLSAAGATVIIGAENAQKRLLEQEFPQIKIIPLGGYRVQYARKKSWLLMKLLLQMPRILTRIYDEHNWVKRVVDQENINLVISDNRYGLWHPTVQSIIITHQLQVALPFSWAEKLVQWRLYKWINRFTECWIPDMEKGIAGKLSHPQMLPRIPIKYINFLSRFEKMEVEKKFKYCFLISGPEPQRTIFEEKIFQIVSKIEGTTVIVRGLLDDHRPSTIDHGSSIVDRPSSAIPSEARNVYPHLPTAQLGELIQQSEYIICRGGYTSLMELIALKKKIIVVPTPSQTEQEYLAETLMQQGLVTFIDQEEFDQNFLDNIKNKQLQIFDAIAFKTNDIVQLLKNVPND